MNKNEIIKILRNICDEIALKKHICDNVANYCNQTYSVPLSYVYDLISDRQSLEGLSEKELFFLADGINKSAGKVFIKDLFTADEIEKYSKSIYEAGSLDWPLRINCVEVSSNKGKQWIGATDVKWLMALNKANKIRYNADKQRTRTKIIQDNQVIFQNTLVKKSVKQISDLMIKGDYIPDDITLDIPEEVDCKYEYNEETSELLIWNIDFFDITDGYHRFQAMIKCTEMIPDFNYPMELRITVFSESRSRQFIYQKDQKNRMSATDSRSLNVFRNSNEVVSRLNERGNGCQFNGLIQRNGGTVDFAALSDIVEHYWFKQGRWKVYTSKDIITATQETKEIMNQIATADPYFLDSRYLDFKKLIVIFWLVKDKGKSVEQAVKILNKLEKNGKINDIKFRNIRKNLFDLLEEITA